MKRVYTPRCPVCDDLVRVHSPAKLKECLGVMANAHREAELRWCDETLRAMGAKAAPITLEPDLLRRLIAFCHPDRHGGDKEATDLTAILLGMRR